MPGEKIMFDIEEACQAMSLSRSTLYRAIAAGELRVIHFGRAVRVSLDELRHWAAVRHYLDRGEDLGTAHRLADAQAAAGRTTRFFKS